MTSEAQGEGVLDVEILVEVFPKELQKAIFQTMNPFLISFLVF